MSLVTDWRLGVVTVHFCSFLLLLFVLQMTGDGTINMWRARGLKPLPLKEGTLFTPFSFSAPSFVPEPCKLLRTFDTRRGAAGAPQADWDWAEVGGPDAPGVYSICLSEDGRRLYSGGEDRWGRAIELMHSFTSILLFI